MSLWKWLKKRLRFDKISAHMAPLKESVIKMIKGMPETASLPDIMAELYFREKVEKGLADADKKRVVSHEKVKMHFKKWLKLK